MGQRFVITDHAFLNADFEQACAEQLGASFDVFSCTTVSETINAVQDADVVLVNFAPVTREVLASMKQRSTIIRYGIGYDNVDIESAKELGIRVANVPDYGVETVADHAAASLLALCRHLTEYTKLINANGWARPGDVGVIPGFRSMTVGFVGLGRIALALHKRLVPFGFSFVAFDPYASSDTFSDSGITSVSLDELAERSHAISLHAPNNEQTRHIVNASFLERLRPGAVIVNTARGSLIDEAALLEALQKGTLAGVALDVTDPEPLERHSPIREFPNVILTPHAAFYDEDSLRNLQRLASEEAGRALRGEALRCQVA